LLAKNGDAASFVAALRVMIEDDRLRARCGIAARAEVEQRLTDVATAARSIDVYRAWLDGNALPESRVAVTPPIAGSDDAARQEAVELHLRVAKLETELEAVKRREQNLKTSREWRWGKALLNIVPGRKRRE